ncbi:MAG TPA: cob(I)yrinic acid a,c-diamide adenosyltransferase [Flavobacteriaceae bacterium]|nr:cob(I)yrinic acid a,c-diamide adenosyltransferase [Flavobacteriaceae bacterium]
MRIYTRTGDKGTTALFGGTRVPKYHLRIETYGTIDELNANIGMIRSQEISETHQKILIEIQKNLFAIGSELATDPDKAKMRSGEERLKIKKIREEQVKDLEQEIDQMNEKLPPLRHFLLPGGHQTISFCHISRTVCRRAERLATALFEESPFDESLLKYLNRLSDYLFVLARKISQELEVEETPWISE